MQASICQNCGTQMESGFRFCPNCGQTAETHRFTMPHFLHEAGHAFTHADKGIFFLIKELAIKPGIVLKEYIIEGKRKRYFNPFTFMLLMSGLLLFFTIVFKPYDTDTMGMTKADAKEYYAQLPQAQKIMERQKRFAVFMEQNTKIISLISVPMTAFIFWLFFRRKGLYYAEHLVAALFLTGFFTIFNTLMTPVMAMLKGSAVYLNVSLLPLVFQVIYFGWAYCPFLAAKSKVQKWKVYGVSLVNVLVWSLLWVLVGAVYMVVSFING